MREVFWRAFDEAEECGEATISTVANILFQRWKDNIEELTEFVMVVNHKSWDYYEKSNNELCEIYTELYYKYYEKAIEYLESKDRSEDLSYFIRTLD